MNPIRCCFAVLASILFSLFPEIAVVGRGSEGSTPVSPATVVTEPGINEAITSALAAADLTLQATTRWSSSRWLLGGVPKTSGSQPLPALKWITLDSEGRIQPAFPELDGISGALMCMLVLTDGSVLMGGEGFQRNGAALPPLFRVTASGLLDSTFLQQSRVTSGRVRVLTPETDGTIWIGGEFLTKPGTVTMQLARLSGDGLIDTTFDGESAVFDNEVRTILTMPDGHILVGGEFLYYQNQRADYLVRLDRSGTWDSAYLKDSKPNARVRTLARTSDGSVWVGGDFKRMGTERRVLLARLFIGASLAATALPATSDADQVHQVVPLSNGDVAVAGDFILSTPLTGEGLVLFDLGGAPLESCSIKLRFPNDVKHLVELGENRLLIAGEFTLDPSNTLPEIVVLDICPQRGPPLPSVAWGSSRLEVTEGGKPERVVVQRAGDITRPLRVRIRGESGTAVLGRDYLLLDTEIEFQPGVAVESVRVMASEDARFNGTRVATLRLISEPDFRLEQATVEIIVRDNDRGIVAETLGSYRSETEPTAFFRIARRDDVPGSATASFRTVSRTATAGTDFLSTSGEVTLPSGESSVEVSVPLINDGKVEGSEYFDLIIENVSGVSQLGEPSRTSVTIADNDSHPAVGMEPGVVSESEGGHLDILIRRLDDGTEIQRVRYQVLDPEASQDLLSPTGEVDLLPGIDKVTHLRIPLINDCIPESPEYFRILIQSLFPWTPGWSQELFVRVSDDDGIGGDLPLPGPDGLTHHRFLPDEGFLALGVRPDMDGGQKLLRRFDSTGREIQDFARRASVIWHNRVGHSSQRKLLQVFPIEDGTIIVVTAFGADLRNQIAVVDRLRSDGSPDSNFQARLFPLVVPEPLIRLSDGSFVLLNTLIQQVSTTGSPDYRLELRRFQVSGAELSDFKSDHSVRLFQFASAQEPPLVLTADVGPGVGFYVGGRFDRFDDESVDAMVRLNPDGTKDQSFKSEVLPFFSHPLHVNSVRVMPDRRVMVAGNRMVPNGDVPAGQVVVKRMAPSGRLDPTYTPVRTHSVPLNRALIRGFAVSPEGDAIVSMQVGGIVVRHYLPDGTENPGFRPLVTAFAEDCQLLSMFRLVFREGIKTRLVSWRLPTQSPSIEFAGEGSRLIRWVGDHPSGVWLEFSTDLKSWTPLRHTPVFECHGIYMDSTPLQGVGFYRVRSAESNR